MYNSTTTISICSLTKEQVVERLLEQKAITVTEAVILLKTTEKIIEKQINTTQQAFDPFWYNPDPFKPLRIGDFYTTSTNTKNFD